uniref:(northern house mosquito) hypothetical protein n=1 Tax=Culex pipiens TaxID=7175 RepID=A0A8D8AE11_CULPI
MRLSIICWKRWRFLRPILCTGIECWPRSAKSTSCSTRNAFRLPRPARQGWAGPGTARHLPSDEAECVLRWHRARLPHQTKPGWSTFSTRNAWISTSRTRTRKTRSFVGK